MRVMRFHYEKGGGQKKYKKMRLVNETVKNFENLKIVKGGENG